MYRITKDNFTVFPIDFNVFINTATNYKKRIRFAKEYTITEEIFSELNTHILTDKESIFFAIDMENINSYPPRMFSKLALRNEYIFFYNVNNLKLKQRLEEDLENVIWIRENAGCFSELYRDNIENFLDKESKYIRKYKQIDIILGLVEGDGDIVQPLESSGLYSNFYINVKKLFLNISNWYYIMFCLAQKVSKIEKRIDAFITSSKNGAIIANILGGLLDIKEVYLVGIGPKYSMEFGDSVDCIKEGKRYVYIFDFLCTGTELKIVRTLINSKKAYLSYAAGISKYSREQFNKKGKDIVVLADTKELGINYKIVGEASDIKRLFGEECDDKE